MAMELQEMHVLIRSRAFYLAASYRQIKKITSLRPRRLVYSCQIFFLEIFCWEPVIILE